MNDSNGPVFLADHVATINDAHRNLHSDLFVLVDACALADKDLRLKAKRKREFTKKLDFSAAEFSKCVQIGKDERLKDPALRKRLPPNYSTIYAVHQLDDQQLSDLLATSNLSTLRRSDVLALRRRDTANIRKVELNGFFSHAVKPARTLTGTELASFEEELAGLAKKYDLELFRPPERLISGQYERTLRYMRTECRGVVRAWVKRRKAELGRNAFKTQPALRKYAGFLADELEIGSDADEDRLQSVLETLGSDAFEIIRAKAHELHPVQQAVFAPIGSKPSQISHPHLRPLPRSSMKPPL